MARVELHGPASAPEIYPRSATVGATTTLMDLKEEIGRTGGGMARLGYGIEAYGLQLCGIPAINSNSRKRDEAERGNRSKE